MAKSTASLPAGQAPAEVTLNDTAVLLSKLGHRAKRMFTQRLEPLALKANHVQVLVFLGGHPGASQRGLVDALRVTPSTVVDLIDELQDRGLVQRTRNPLNRRASLLSLTGEGHVMLRRALALSREVEQDLLAPLAARDRPRLLGYLRVIDSATRRPWLRAPSLAPAADPDDGAVAAVDGSPLERATELAVGELPSLGAELAGSSSKADHAYETLRRWIAEGVYRPGDRLVLQQIARDLKISTVPVREAIRRLEAEGFASFQRNVGARVSSVDTARYADSMKTLAILEGAATAMAAERLTERDLQAAARINEKMAAGLAKLDPASFTKANREFHEALCRPCGNTHLLALIDLEWSRLAAIRISTFAFIPERAASAVQEHQRLLERLAAGARGPEIEALIRQHRLATIGAFLKRQGEAAHPA